MCPSESKVVLNYDNIPDLESRYKGAIIQPHIPQKGGSKPRYLMVDTVHMAKRQGMTWEEMCKIAKEAAPLAERIVVDWMYDNASCDNKSGMMPVSAFATYPVYAM